MYESQHVTDDDIKQMFQIYQENIRALITLRHAYVNGNIAKKMRKRDEDEFLKQLQEIKEEKRKARLDDNQHKNEEVDFVKELQDIYHGRREPSHALIARLQKL